MDMFAILEARVIPSLGSSAYPLFSLRLRNPWSSLTSTIKTPPACHGYIPQHTSQWASSLSVFPIQPAAVDTREILTFRFRVRDQWAASQRVSSITLGTMWCGPYTYWYISPAVNHSYSLSTTHENPRAILGQPWPVLYNFPGYNTPSSNLTLLAKKKTLTEDLAYNILHNESLEVTWKLIMRWDASGYILIEE